MSVNLKLVSLFSVGTVGAAGSVYVGMKFFHSSEKKITFGDKYKGTLITNSSGDDSKWEARKTKLTGDSSSEMDSSLREVKSKNALKSEDIKNWCSKVSSTPFEEFSTKIKWFETYCVYTVKEKIGSSFISGTDSSSWTKANSNLIGKGKDKLSRSLQAIFDKLSPTSQDVNALQKHCHLKQDDVFRGEGDDLYKEISTYCVDSTQ
ncbi:hypothetical protein MHC_03055 [Mycoplasma haemocanis str. Illinois]|uniref:Uncharacterized protein n=1 Tax=Mycoplasma haemocanis (strain Illinois) TaxID=1111676 RepID=H6N749_MYCHN|nr:hypothetical protein [Mycoplasma haemocanis]AEW45471.1 hypothetical protein MHC_03055 [Mycoplasma haemocanis str. Illinois]